MDYWVTVIIVILIVGITLDGVRRMRIARREGVRLSRNAKKFDDADDIPVSSSEFPSGGARVAQVRDTQEASSLNENVRKSFEAKKVTKGAPSRLPEQVSLNLETPVPMLMDSVESPASEHRGGGEGVGKARPANRNEEDSYEENSYEEKEGYHDPREPSLGSFENLDDEDEQAAFNNELESSYDNNYQSSESDFSDYEKAEKNTPKSEPAASKEKPKQERQKASAESAHDYSEPEEVLVMNVMAKAGTRIAGEDLLNALMAEGLKFGDMDIFHRYKDNDGDGPVIFSLANMVVPGTFNLAEMSEFETPGVSIFLSLPVEIESLTAYNDMATTAKNLAHALGAELKDENRSVMTNQTIEHGRQRVIEYERKKKLARA